MIKKVHLKNFESHEDSEIDFTDGLNLIIGQSNQGKSSIVRAIALVCANRFDKDCVRTGSDFCEVTVETDKGSVTAQRGESVNRWIVRHLNGETKEYKNLGLSVPPDAFEVLGIGERTHGDIKELPNIMFQLEKHYMLSEIDGKKATSNMIARMMDDAIGIGGMEDLIKDMATDFQSFKKDLNDCVSSISEKKSEIMEESIFKDKEESVKLSRSMFNDVQEIKSLLDQSYDLSRKISVTKETLCHVNEELCLIDDLNESYDQFETVARKYLDISSAISTMRLIDCLNGSIESIRKLEHGFLDLENGQSKLKDISCAKRTSEMVNELSMFDRFRSMFDEFGELDSLFKRISSAKEDLDNARRTYRKIMKTSSDLKSEVEGISRSSNDLDKLKEELGECPLCGSKFTKGK